MKSNRLEELTQNYEALINRKNEICNNSNGIYKRYYHPVLTAEHAPLIWKYDFDEKQNPFMEERIGINAVMNTGAIKINHKYYLVARVEGADRKSFFAVAESNSPVDGFRFWDYPIEMPETDIPDTNMYDMRLTAHEDGWIYGIFCAERKDTNAPAGDLSSAVAVAGIARTKDLKTWQRLPDLKSPSQQRNVVLHPEFVNGKYALYTRPQDGFIDAGNGGGIGWALIDDICHAEIKEEKIINKRFYHTIKEVKNGEVVERPASVVKELLENSIDAGASQITVSIESGGVRLIEISDNGTGIEAKYIPTAFIRHATSKIRTEDDLTSIHTLGFRGEALASIASVARVEVLTRTEADECASLYRIEGGEEQPIEPGARGVGTTIRVCDLFFNTPARMKFLKKDSSEGTFVADIVGHVALSHPEVSFKFIREGKLQYVTPGDGQLRSAAYAVLGREFSRDLVEVADQSQRKNSLCGPCRSSSPTLNR